jgi:hypothetical protein
MRMLFLVWMICAALPALADEGMWTFDNFPTSRVEQTYGAGVSAAWLDHVRLATVRIANCTGSFVSSNGLILTNQHCIESCLGALSSKEHNLLEQGFIAADRAAERPCGTQLADVLVATEDVTAAVNKASAGLADSPANEARKRALTALEQGCEQAGVRSKRRKLTCQAVTLYGGGQYFLYKYQRYEDVRLVFAPEVGVANFGGDPDNFQFPRWNFDIAVLRAYEDGRPAKTPDFLRIDFAGPRADELVFVSGQPSSTSRMQTLAQIEFERDLVLPMALMRTSELRGGYKEFGRINPFNEQLIAGPLESLENGIKVRRKLLDALHDDALIERKRDEENTLRQLAQLPQPDPWAQIESATAREREIYWPYTFIENGMGFNSTLFRYARLLLRGANERAKPNTARLREYTDASLGRIEQQITAQVPFDRDVEAMTLTFSLQRMREWLGPDYPLTHRLFAAESPSALATRVVAETKLDEAGVRLKLWQGGKAAVDASRDPMIELARALDADARALRRQFEDSVEAPISAASQRIAAARFRAYGTHVYPDATFTLRLSYGTVTGWVENGESVAPFTRLDRAFERATGADPFRLPDSWLKVKDQLDPLTPFCFTTNNDLVGGSSGSALINVRGEMVGVMFDANIHSISGAYWFDAARNRAIAVHPAIMREALDKVYGAHSLLAELNNP